MKRQWKNYDKLFLCLHSFGNIIEDFHWISTRKTAISFLSCLIDSDNCEITIVFIMILNCAMSQKPMTFLQQHLQIWLFYLNNILIWLGFLRWEICYLKQNEIDKKMIANCCCHWWNWLFGQKMFIFETFQ